MSRKTLAPCSLRGGSSHPTRRTSQLNLADNRVAAVCAVPRSTSTSSRRSSAPVRARSLSICSTALASDVEAGTTRAERQPSHVHADDALGPVSATVRTTLVVKSGATVRGPTCEVRADDHHRRPRVHAAKSRTRGHVQSGEYSGPGSVPRPPTELGLNSGPGTELPGQESPLAPGVRDVEHHVDDVAKVISVLRNSFGCNQ